HGHDGDAHRQGVARLLAHDGGVDLVAVLVSHTEARGALLHVVHGTARAHFALVLRHGLVAVGQVVAHAGTDDGAGAGGHVLAAAAADLVAHDAADHGAQDGAADVGIAGRTGFGHPLAGAFLAGHLHGLVLGLHRLHAGTVHEGRAGR